MQENKDSNRANHTVRGKITLTSVYSAHTFFPSLCICPVNVWCVVYFANRAEKYIYIYIRNGKCRSFDLSFNSLPGTYLWHAPTSRRFIFDIDPLDGRSNEPTLPPLLFIYRKRERKLKSTLSWRRKRGFTIFTFY